MTDAHITPNRFDTLDRTIDRITGFISGIAVLGLLAGAMVIVVDVVLRATGLGGVTALNEIMGQMFGMGVAATLPAGAARRVNLKVDLMARHFGPRVTHLLAVAGSLALFIFFAALTFYVWSLGLRFLSQGRETLILKWPLGPTYIFAAIAMGLACFVQGMKVLKDLAIRPENTAARTSKIGLAMVAVLFAVVIAGSVWAFVDLPSLQDLSLSRPGLFVILAFALLWLAVLCQIPLSAATALLGLAGTAIVLGLKSTGKVFANDAVEFLTNWQVATLPMFLMMGSFAVAAGISDDIYRVANAFLGRIKGGLAYATVAGCAGFGAVSGSSVATAATFGRIALPEMAKRNYAPSFAAGTVAAGGTLGALVPPSGAIILFALLTEQSIGVLFIAAMVPAILALLLYFAAIFVQLRLNPDFAPETAEEKEPILPALWAAAPVILLFGVVIGGLYGGVFTATESAAVGAVGAFILAVARGRLNRFSLLGVLSETTATTALIYGLIFGALIFSFYVNLGQATEFVANAIGSLDASPMTILIVLLVFYLLLGAVMDSFAVMVITVPVVTPLVMGLGFDVFHWGILMLVVVEIGLISPPFGINLFILKNLQPDQPLSGIMRGVLPFIAADLVKIILLVAFPAISLWLPSTMN
ncbi:Sialic acid TRAP transporter permease protein SiaT [Pelagimonas phthalicica]|uniref:Sialic acid TRAP transporter permease protein SiaT n=1 Tax=Pelagimonas phthalicica TaxID=1037362 RepID=A0A238JHM8_9RHOB|nr:TRAP transporter large permease subunit [Pelagimonas phthalicica]TDS89735.1 tripartite ATP-independent transporter DctM subunit [Pelagimonas phthalicica]SMX29903.1 Sialic acid TRAP transporter permease protein SiaT [Pelagimonas phthalicica]